MQYYPSPAVACLSQKERLGLPQAQEILISSPLLWGTARRRNNAAHLIETTGAKLRDMMPWIKAGKVIDKEKN